MDCQDAFCDLAVGQCPSAFCDVEVTINEGCQTCEVEVSGGCKDVLIKSCKLDDCILCCDPHKSGFFWNNWCLCEGAELTASSLWYECDAFHGIDSAVNACDCSFTEAWKFRGTGSYNIKLPEAKPLEAIIIWGQNLYVGSDGVTSGRVEVRDSSGTRIQPTNWDQPYATVDEDEPVFMYFDGTPYDELRIVFIGATTALGTGSNDELCDTSGDPHCIENIFIGECMEIPDGLRKFASPFNGSEYSSKIKSSACGPLSRSLTKKAIDMELVLEGLCYEWLIEKWRPFLCYLQRYPVYFSWSKNRFPDEVARVWLDDCVEPSEFTDSHFSSLVIPLKAQISQGKK